MRLFMLCALAGLLIAAYPSAAAWLSDNVPFAYWILMPWSTPIFSALAIALGFFVVLGRKELQADSVARWVVKIAALCLFLVWASFIVYLAWVQFKGGL